MRMRTRRKVRPQSPSWRRATGKWPRSSVEHGRRARRASHRPGVSGPDHHRSVESRECVDVAHVALSGQSVVDALEALSTRRPLSKAITWITGPNSRPRPWTNGPTDAESLWIFVRPGKPKNALIESFSGRLRDESLNVYSFELISHAQAVISTRRDDYDHHRAHGALGHLTPSEHAEQRQSATSEAAPLQLAPSGMGATSHRVTPHSFLTRL